MKPTHLKFIDSYYLVDYNHLNSSFKSLHLCFVHTLVWLINTPRRPHQGVNPSCTHSLIPSKVFILF